MNAGYIYVKNWNRHQHYKNRRPVWIKLYMDLLDNDEYLALTLAERGLLQDIWKLTALAGNGRVTASRETLGRRLNVRRVSLEPLIRAGFIEVRASKAASQPASDPASLEGLTTLTPEAAPPNGGARRSGKRSSSGRSKQVTTCKRLYQRELDDGQTPVEAWATCEYEFRHDPTLVTEAIGERPTPVVTLAAVHQETA